MTDHRKVIGTVVSREDYLVPKAGGVFDAEEYDAHPDRYRSTFAETVSMSKIKNKRKGLSSNVIPLLQSQEGNTKFSLQLFYLYMSPDMLTRKN